MKNASIRLYCDPWYTFRFAEARCIPNFYLPGTPKGRMVRIHSARRMTGEPGDLLRRAITEDDGRVCFDPPLLVQAGDVLLAVPESEFPAPSVDSNVLQASS